MGACRAGLIRVHCRQNLASSGHMAPAVSEAALYTQLTHFYRLLDPTLALSRCKDDAEKLEAQKCALKPPCSCLTFFLGSSS